MTYKEIEQQYPKEYEARQQDKLRYRYPRGESYEDLIQRLEPVIVELERQRFPVVVVGHQAVLRCLYAYFQNCNRSEAPHLEFPYGCVVSLLHSAQGTREERFVVDS